MKKISLFIVTLFILTACQNPANQTNPPAANTHTGVKNSPNQGLEIKPEKTSTQIGGIKVEGVVDVNSLQKNNPQNGSSNVSVSNKKGILINSKGFTPAEVEVPLSKELLIFNGGENDVEIISMNKDCTELGDKLVLKKGETKTITFQSLKECPIQNATNSEQRALIKVVQ